MTFSSLLLLLPFLHSPFTLLFLFLLDNVLESEFLFASSEDTSFSSPFFLFGHFLGVFQDIPFVWRPRAGDKENGIYIWNLEIRINVKENPPIEGTRKAQSSNYSCRCRGWTRWTASGRELGKPKAGSGHPANYIIEKGIRPSGASALWWAGICPV